MDELLDLQVLLLRILQEQMFLLLRILLVAADADVANDLHRDLRFGVNKRKRFLPLLYTRVDNRTLPFAGLLPLASLSRYYRLYGGHARQTHDRRLQPGAEEIDEQTRKRQVLLQTSLRAYRAADTIAADAIQTTFFDQVSRAEVAQQLTEIET